MCPHHPRHQYCPWPGYLHHVDRTLAIIEFSHVTVNLHHFYQLQ